MVQIIEKILPQETIDHIADSKERGTIVKPEDIIGYTAAHYLRRPKDKSYTFYDRRERIKNFAVPFCQLANDFYVASTEGISNIKKFNTYLEQKFSNPKSYRTLRNLFLTTALGATGAFLFQSDINYSLSDIFTQTLGLPGVVIAFSAIYEQRRKHSAALWAMLLTFIGQMALNGDWYGAMSATSLWYMHHKLLSDPITAEHSDADKKKRFRNNARAASAAFAISLILGIAAGITGMGFTTPDNFIAHGMMYLGNLTTALACSLDGRQNASARLAFFAGMIGAITFHTASTGLLAPIAATLILGGIKANTAFRCDARLTDDNGNVLTGRQQLSHWFMNAITGTTPVGLSREDFRILKFSKQQRQDYLAGRIFKDVTWREVKLAAIWARNTDEKALEGESLEFNHEQKRDDDAEWSLAESNFYLNMDVNGDSDSLEYEIVHGHLTGYEALDQLHQVKSYIRFEKMFPA